MLFEPELEHKYKVLALPLIFILGQMHRQPRALNAFCEVRVQSIKLERYRSMRHFLKE